MVSRVIPVNPFDLVLFGATGDLAQRKILPGLYHRFEVGQMPEDARIIGTARSDRDSDAFRDQIRASMKEFAPKFKKDVLDQFLNRVEYVPVDAMGEAGWSDLAKAAAPGCGAGVLSVGWSQPVFGHCATSAVITNWPHRTVASWWKSRLVTIWTRPRR